MTDDTGIILWKQRTAQYWTDFNPNDFPDTFPTTPEQNEKLRLAYKDRYGKEGSQTVNALVVSEKLNGGENPDPDKHFPSLTYSLPLALYFMRRAIDVEMDDAYKIFTHDVHAYAHMNPDMGDHERIPTLKHVEKLIHDDLVRIGRPDLTQQALEWESMSDKAAGNMKVGISAAFPILVNNDDENSDGTDPSGTSDDLDEFSM